MRSDGGRKQKPNGRWVLLSPMYKTTKSAIAAKIGKLHTSMMKEHRSCLLDVVVDTSKSHSKTVDSVRLWGVLRARGACEAGGGRGVRCEFECESADNAAARGLTASVARGLPPRQVP